MAHHKSAKKRIRQTAKRNERNSAWRSALRTTTKKLRNAIDEGDSGKAKELLPQTISMVDGVVSKGILHKNTGARYVSRLTVAVHKLLAGNN